MIQVNDQKVNERFYGLGYKTDNEEECHQCQKHNHPQLQPRAQLSLIKCGYLFDVTSWVLCQHPQKETSTFCMVVADLFSKWVKAFPSLLQCWWMKCMICMSVWCSPCFAHSDQDAILNSQVIVASWNEQNMNNNLSPSCKWASRAF